jgi:hypothetical protein
MLPYRQTRGKFSVPMSPRILVSFSFRVVFVKISKSDWALWLVPVIEGALRIS